jgi:hypothetical protein
VTVCKNNVVTMPSWFASTGCVLVWLEGGLTTSPPSPALAVAACPCKSAGKVVSHSVMLQTTSTDGTCDFSTQPGPTCAVSFATCPTGGAGTGDAGGAQKSCQTSAACGATDVCVFAVNGSGTCIQGSSQGCGGDNSACINTMGFRPVGSSSCQTTPDCGSSGTWVGVCVDATGTSRECVGLCQYVGDSEQYGCATVVGIGVRQDCSRLNARIFLAVAQTASCTRNGNIDTMTCTKVASGADISNAFESTLECLEQGGCMSCFTDGVPPGANATQSTTTFLNAANASGTRWKVSQGSAGVNGKCSTDCDCGHCNYCESGTCRYGGEGPYGCYRGCP